MPPLFVNTESSLFLCICYTIELIFSSQLNNSNTDNSFPDYSLGILKISFIFNLRSINTLVHKLSTLFKLKLCFCKSLSRKTHFCYVI